MSAKEKLSNLKEKCVKNKIAVPLAFYSILDANFNLDECYAFAEGIVEAVDDAVTDGINLGFAIKDKNNIVDLANLAIDASKAKKLVQLEKLEKYKGDILKGMKPHGDTINVKEPLVNLLQNTIDGTTSILSVRGGKDGLYENVLNTLENAKEQLKSVSDSTSLPASEYQKQVAGQVLLLRKKIAKKTLTPTELKSITNNINKVITDWKTLNDAKAKKAKKGDFFVFDATVKDSFYIVTSTSEFLEKYKVVEDLMTEFKNGIDNEKLKDHEYITAISEKQKEKALKVQKGQEIVALLHAGKTTEANAQRALTIVNAEVEKIDREINSLNLQRDSGARTTSSKETLLRSVKNALAQVDKENPSMLYAFATKMDLEALSSLFNGVPTNEDINKVLHGLSTAITYAQEQAKQIEVAAGELDATLAEAAEEVANRLEEQLTENGGEKISLDELVKKFQADVPASEEAPKVQEAEMLSVDDLLN